MFIRTTSQLAKHCRWALLNVQTDEVVELKLTRKEAQAACDEMHRVANITNWLKVGRNPGFESDLPAGTNLMSLGN